MYVSSLRLRNVRQFRDKTLEFKPGFNLLVGENGAGKSTLLRALLAVLGSANQSGRKPALTDEDIRFQTQGLDISASVLNEKGKSSRTLIYVKRWGSRAQRPRNIAAPLVINYGSNEAICSSFVGQRIRKFSRDGDIETFRGEGWLYEAETGGSFSRDANNPGGRFGQSRVVRRFVVNVLSLFSTKFKNFYWRFVPYDCSIRSRDESELSRIFSRDDRRLITNSIMRDLQEARRPLVWPDQPRVEVDFEGNLIDRGNSRVERLRGFPDLSRAFGLGKKIPNLKSCTIEFRLTPRIVIRAKNGNFLISQLSDGEKRLFSLFVDIARQLSIQSKTVDFKKTPAIVMIDEVDVHLHPKWQRMIVPALEDLFPACQFIATTHSPFVIQATSAGRLQRIDGNRPANDDYIGKSIEDIIEVIQGVKMPQRSKRAEEMSRAAESYFSLLRRGSDASPEEIKVAEIAYRNASEAFTSEPGLAALLKLEIMAAQGS